MDQIKPQTLFDLAIKALKGASIILPSLPACLLVYKLVKIIQDNRRLSDFVAARFDKESINENIKSFLDDGCDYFQGGGDVIYCEEDIQMIALILTEEPEYHKIKTILMEETQLSDRGLLYLTKIPFLTNLTISYNDITDEGIKIIGSNCTNLVRLDLSGNRINSLEPLYKLKKLSVLIVTHTNITDCEDQWLLNSNISCLTLYMTKVPQSRQEEIKEIIQKRLHNRSKSESPDTTTEDEPPQVEIESQKNF